MFFFYIYNSIENVWRLILLSGGKKKKKQYKSFGLLYKRCNRKFAQSTIFHRNNKRHNKRHNKRRFEFP